MDIGTEEISHLEVVGTLARMHLKPPKDNRRAAHEDPLIRNRRRGGVNLFNAARNARELPVVTY
jgi:Mn-containing catalase